MKVQYGDSLSLAENLDFLGGEIRTCTPEDIESVRKFISDAKKVAIVQQAKLRENLDRFEKIGVRTLENEALLKTENKRQANEIKKLKRELKEKNEPLSAHDSLVSLQGFLAGLTVNKSDKALSSIQDQVAKIQLAIEREVKQNGETE